MPLTGRSLVATHAKLHMKRLNLSGRTTKWTCWSLLVMTMKYKPLTIFTKILITGVGAWNSADIKAETDVVKCLWKDVSLSNRSRDIMDSFLESLDENERGV